MDPFSMIIGITIAAYVVGGVTADTWAVATRQTPPSIQKAQERHERKLARGEDSNPAPSYLGRIAGNAAERWADKSDRKHRDRMAWIEERDPQRSSRRMNRKRRNAARYEQAAQKAADKRGQLWGATKDAVEAARQRRAEGQARRRNVTEPDLLDRDDWHPDDDLDDRPDHDEHQDDDEGEGAGPGATVLEFTRPDNARPKSQSKPQSISDGAEIWGDPADPATWTGTDKFGRDIQTGEGERYTDANGDVIHNSDKFLLGDDLSPERRIVQYHQHDLEKLSEHQADLVRRLRQSNSTREQIAFGEQDWYGLPVDLRARLLDEATRAGNAPVTYSSTGEPVRGTDLDTEAAELMQETPPDTPPAKPDPDASWVPNPYWKPGAIRESQMITQGELRRRREREDRADDADERERERVHELALAQLQTPDGEQPGPEQESLDENGEPSMAEQTQTEQTEQANTAGTTTGEITSLQDALAYTRTMSNRLSAIQSETDGMGAQLNRLNSNARAAVQEIEQAVADLGSSEVEGKHVGELSSAGEEMNTLAEAAREATKQLATLSEAATTAQRGFTTARQAFQAQTSLEEEIQTANASGNRAGKREFYENA